MLRQRQTPCESAKRTPPPKQGREIAPRKTAQQH